MKTFLKILAAFSLFILSFLGLIEIIRNDNPDYSGWVIFLDLFWITLLHCMAISLIVSIMTDNVNEPSSK